jgi:hypothetical protein
MSIGLISQCPNCNWIPSREALWQCECGHSWNTFDTRGKCPQCEKQWTTTQCINSGEWSAHDDWYKK